MTSSLLANPADTVPVPALPPIPTIYSGARASDTLSNYNSIPSHTNGTYHDSSGFDGISMTHFAAKDVVRHPLVQRIVEAYAAFEATTGATQ